MKSTQQRLGACIRTHLMVDLFAGGHTSHLCRKRDEASEGVRAVAMLLTHRQQATRGRPCRRGLAARHIRFALQAPGRSCLLAPPKRGSKTLWALDSDHAWRRCGYRWRHLTLSGSRRRQEVAPACCSLRRASLGVKARGREAGSKQASPSRGPVGESAFEVVLGQVWGGCVVSDFLAVSFPEPWQRLERAVPADSCALAFKCGAPVACGRARGGGGEPPARRSASLVAWGPACGRQGTSPPSPRGRSRALEGREGRSGAGGFAMAIALTERGSASQLSPRLVLRAILLAPFAQSFR